MKTRANGVSGTLQFNDTWCGFDLEISHPPGALDSADHIHAMAGFCCDPWLALANYALQEDHGAIPPTRPWGSLKEVSRQTSNHRDLGSFPRRRSGIWLLKESEGRVVLTVKTIEMY